VRSAQDPRYLRRIACFLRKTHVFELADNSRPMADSLEVRTGDRSQDELLAGLELVRESPREAGTLEMIVARPAVDERILLASGELQVDRGLVADRWSRGRGLNPKSQLTVMNARAAVRRLRPQPGKPPSWDPPRDRVGGDRGQRPAPPRLREVRGAVRADGARVRQLARGHVGQLSWDQHAGGAIRHRPRRRRDPQALSDT
jgi:hypothetical protein